MMKYKILYIIFFLLPIHLVGQEVVFKVEYPGVVTVGEQFTVTWTVNSGGGEFTAPSFNGFYKLMGPQTSYSSNTQIINGKISQETSYSYVFYLQAMNEGKFVIPPANLNLKRKVYQSDSLHIEVIKDAAGRQTVQNNNPAAGSPVETQAQGSDIFLKLTLSRNEIFQGEHVIATIKLYTRVDLSGLNEAKFPAFNGFLKENLETPPLTSLQRENVNGIIYGTGIVQQFLLYPQITGEIKIEPVEITALIQQKTRQSDPFFGEFFGSYQTVPRVIVSQPVKILVKPLPGNKPDDFSGAVGKFEMSAAINKDTVNVNDAVNYRITISGAGNLKLAGAPVLKLSSDIEVYDPKVTDNIKNNANGSSGQKTFEYLLIPRHYGEYKIPSFTYTYFNSSKGQYEKLFTREFHFYARKGTDQGSGITVFGGVSKEDVKYMGKDIRFIKSSGQSLKKAGNIIVTKRSFLSIYGFALFIFLAVLFIRREHIRRNSDISIVRNRKAAKIAGKRLKEAHRCLKDGLNDKFYEEILKALWGYLSDKLNIPVSELTRNNAFLSLKEMGIVDERINNLSGILDACEFTRFSPSASGTETIEIYNGALQFIKSVENTIG
jgi:hypothetical protein